MKQETKCYCGHTTYCDCGPDEEKSYNDEEVIELLQKALTHQDDGETGSLVTAQGKIRTANFYSWFERFKNK